MKCEETEAKLSLITKVLSCSSELPKRRGFSAGEVVLNNGNLYVADEFGYLIDAKDATALSYVLKEREELRVRVKRLSDALQRLADCDWTITPHHRMDAVRAIAREALL